MLALHLLKEVFQPERAGRSWAVTIPNQRQEILRHMRDNSSLEARAPEIFAEAYADARTLAAAETGLPLATFPAVPPFSQEQALDESYWPGRTLEDRGRA